VRKRAGSANLLFGTPGQRPRFFGGSFESFRRSWTGRTQIGKLTLDDSRMPQIEELSVKAAERKRVDARIEFRKWRRRAVFTEQCREKK
jgi:hypothetical protein